ncbi:MAG: endonuclease [Bacteroidota bacterium]
MVSLLRRLSFALVFCMAPHLAHGQGAAECTSSTFQTQTIGAGLQGSALLSFLRTTYKPGTLLSYDNARDRLYGDIDNSGGTVTGVYTGKQATGIPQDPSSSPRTTLFNAGIDTEHSWPTSLDGPLQDMHHLFPTRREVNSARGTLPFREIDDADTDTWYFMDTETGTAPSTNRDLYSERDTGTAFEVREDHRGNTARAMFYIAAVYSTEIAANQSWFDAQDHDLLAWHQGDGADQAEYDRTCAIAAFQGDNINPFVIDPTLAQRAFFPSSSTSVQFAASTASVGEGNGTATLTVTISNPSSSTATTVEVALASGGTATSGTDFSFTSPTLLTFPANSSTSQTVTVAITPDTDDESDETVNFTLQNASGGTSATLGAPSTLTLTIQDDDAASSSLNAWINELHYDNASTDVGEFVEVSVPSSFTDLGNLDVVLYTGSNGTAYGTHDLSGFTAGTTSSGFTLYTKAIAGIQNGAPDGLALCYSGAVVTSGGVAQFLSYEGSFTASGGCADGLTSTDIGVAEASSTPVGSSLALTGTGDDYSDFTWGGPATATAGAPNTSQVLPVELTSFEAIASSDAVTLAWTTASETNNAGFELQQATAGSTFSPTAFVNGYGTTLDAQRYQHTVANLIPGQYRFRLKQVDYDGAFEYSSEVEVTVGVEHSFQLSEAYPNPFNPETVFSVSVQNDQRVEVAVYNLLGQRVRQLYAGTVTAGAAQRVVFDASGLPGGVYLIQARGAEVMQSRTVTLLK